MTDKQSPAEKFLKQAQKSIKASPLEAAKVVGLTERGAAERQIEAQADQCLASLQTSGTCDMNLTLGGDQVSIDVNGLKGTIEATRGDKTARFKVPKLDL